jgi:hypothetical protein
LISNKNNYDHIVYKDFNFSPLKGINYTINDKKKNELENYNYFKSHSESLSKAATSINLNSNFEKKRNKTINIMQIKKNNLLQNNKIFERNNNEIYFSKRKYS